MKYRETLRQRLRRKQMTLGGDEKVKGSKSAIEITKQLEPF